MKNVEIEQSGSQSTNFWALSHCPKQRIFTSIHCGAKNCTPFICAITLSNHIIFWYEGRSINELQNGVIVLIFKIYMWKFRNIRFVGNLILSTKCEFYFHYVTVTSFINIRYVSVAAKSIPRWAAFCYLFSVGKRTQMSFSLRCVQCIVTSVITRPSIHVWCKKFAHGQ